MDTAKLRDALHETNQGLQETLAQFEALRLKKQHLEAVVASISALLGAGEQPSITPMLPPTVALSESYSSENQSKEALPQWAMARDLLLEKGSPMTVPEMIQILATRGQAIKSDGLRVAMLRRPDLFVNPQYGKYGLKVWEAEKAQEDAFNYHQENMMEDTRVA